MMKYFRILGFIILLFNSSCSEKGKAVVYELLSNYSGTLLIEFDRKNGLSLKTDNKGELIINIDSTGRVVTNFPYQEYLKFKTEKYHWNGENNKVQISYQIASTDSDISNEKKVKFCTDVYKSADKEGSFKTDSIKQVKCDGE